MRKYKRKSKLFLLVLLVLGISVGFALLSSTLNITGFAGIKKNTWDIHWDDESIVETNGSVTAITPANVSDTEKKNVSFEVELELPGDYYEFTVDAKNYGTINGVISNISTKYYENGVTTPSDIPSYLNFSVEYVEGGTPAAGDILKAGESKKYKVRVEFKSTETSLPSNSVSGRFEVDTDYNQTKDNKSIKEGDYVWFDPIEYEFCEEGTPGCIAWIALRKDGSKYDLLYRDNNDKLTWTDSNIKTIIDNFTTRWSDKLKVIDSSYDIVLGDNKYEFSKSKARLLTSNEYSSKESVTSVINQHCGYMMAPTVIADYENQRYCQISNESLFCSFISFSQNFVGAYATGMYFHPVITIDSKEVVDGTSGNNTKYDLGELVYFDPVTTNKCDSTTFNLDNVVNSNSTCYKWRVVTINDNVARTNIKLQLDHNLLNKLAWSTTSDWPEYGPDTALTALETATNDWVRVNPITYSYELPNITDSGHGNGYSGYGYYNLDCNNGECYTQALTVNGDPVKKITDNLRARMITGDEVIDIINCVNPTSKSLTWAPDQGVNNHPSMGNDLLWMVENTEGPTPDIPDHATSNKYGTNNWGYWTLTFSTAHSGSAWYLDYQSIFSIYPSSSDYMGIRPLINIEKSKITRD